jgi:hypothetical protein
MISPRKIQDLSPLEPLRHKSLSLDNSLNVWGNMSTSLNTKSSSNNLVGSLGFTSSSLNTAIGGGSGNGFNFMLINPAIYDEEQNLDDSHSEDVYHIPSIINN